MCIHWCIICISNAVPIARSTDVNWLPVATEAPPLYTYQPIPAHAWE